MARPAKKGVDYFSHDCVSGKTIYILEEKHGNDGYAFWFKLLEFLGTKQDHVLDCSNVPDMEYLQAKSRITREKMEEILCLLANLDAIDKELWSQKIVWSQGLIERISPVYVNRKLKTPSKPSFYARNPDQTAVSTEKSTQSKVKESKGEKSKVKSTTVLSASVEADRLNIVKKEYETLSTELAGKDQREVYKAIRDFVTDKKPGFAEPFVDAWNIFAPNNNLETVQEITKDRRDKIRIRTREPAFDFFKILGAIRQNSFYRGENSSNWKIDFNYVIHSEKNYIKLIEKYKENGSH